MPRQGYNNIRDEYLSKFNRYSYKACLVYMGNQTVFEIEKAGIRLFVGFPEELVILIGTGVQKITYREK